MVVFNPYDPVTWRDPYPIYARLRAEEPVHRNEELGFWAFARHADVLAAHNDWDTYSSTGGVTIEGAERGAPMLILKDPPEHRWHRKIIGRVFTPRRIMALEPFIRARAGELLDRHRDVGEFDVVGEFAIKLPLDVISELLGIPAERRSTVSELSDRLAARGPDTDPTAAMEAGAGLLTLYLELVAERRRNPQDDIISMIMNTEVIDDEDGRTRSMSDEEIAFRFLELGFAGHETVAKGIPNGLMALTRFPDQARLLRDDLSLAGKAVEETLRFDPPSQLQGRITTREVVVQGVTIPAGERVMLITGSALRDESVYERPDTYDLRRTEHPSTLFFGFGIHRCLGAHLARLEMKIAFEEIFQRYEEFHVDVDRAVHHVSTNVRGVSHLPLVVDRAGTPATAGV
ncbi:cytochrome P450 [Frankia gtarii]|uniref:cytochrome P450 n=1 Tax=Frankia gtarii TaxID=2950102 RepID=UPI0021C2053A|nr:cytochrome P450 [Frankia gtarii]